MVCSEEEFAAGFAIGSWRTASDADPPHLGRMDLVCLCGVCCRLSMSRLSVHNGECHESTSAGRHAVRWHEHIDRK